MDQSIADLIQNAINAALNKDWTGAISLNEAILKNNKSDIGALSRLAYAFLQTGSIDKAKKIYKKILLLDKYNFIAQKNLDKISLLPNHIHIKKQLQKAQKMCPTDFIEEPGKTKTVLLTNIAQKNILSKLCLGTAVLLKPKKYSIEVRTLENVYIGSLPDDLAFRLLKYLKSGNKYQTYLKNVNKNVVTIFIREIKRGKKFFSQPSFIKKIHLDSFGKKLKKRK